MPKRSATSFVELKFRVRAPLHAKLMAAKKRNDVSLVAEVTRRLEQSFEAEKLHSVYEDAKAGIDEVFNHLEQRSRRLVAADPSISAAPVEDRVAIGKAVNTSLAKAVAALVEVGYSAQGEAARLEAGAEAEAEAEGEAKDGTR